MSLPQVRDIVIYKTRNKYGDVIKREKRKIIRIFRNEKGYPLIEWESQRNQGVCPPFLWQEWCDDVDENKRRGLTVWRTSV